MSCEGWFATAAGPRVLGFWGSPEREHSFFFQPEGRPSSKIRKKTMLFFAFSRVFCVFFPCVFPAFANRTGFQGLCLPEVLF